MDKQSAIDKLIKRQIKLTVLSVIAVLLITSTITYALYQTNHENTVDQTISIGNLGLTQTGTPITLEGLYPMEEDDLTSSYPRYEFTLENKANGVNNDYTLMYELILRADESTTLSQDEFQYVMFKIDNKDAQSLSEVWDSEINGFNILDGRLLSHAETELSPDLINRDVENHSILFWLSTSSPNNIQGKYLALEMSLEAFADRLDYLKYFEFNENDVFGKELSRNDFESITILDTKDVPENAIDSWDASSKQNKSIMIWYTDDDNNELYELYIGQSGGVIANPNCTSLFSMYENLESINLAHLDTSLVTNMSKMFTRSSKLTFLDVSNLNTSNTTNMSYMFGGNDSDIYYHMDLQTIVGLVNFDTANVTDMSYMFYMCNKLTILDISNFDTSNVTHMRDMFNMAHSSANSKLKAIVFGKKWNTSKVTNMIGMFCWCKSLKELDVSSFNTSNVTSMSSMFSGCESLTTLDLSSFNTSKVSNMRGMFNSCRLLKELDLSNFDMSRVDNVSNMLYFMQSIKELKLPSSYRSGVSITLPKTMYDANGVKYTSVTLGSPTGVWLYSTNPKA